jgi:plasmid maintenance system antidote protein VapI
MEEKIRKLLEEAGYKKQKDAAKALGIEPPYLGLILTGRAKISWNIAFKLEKIIKISAYDIMRQQLEIEYNKKMREINNEHYNNIFKKYKK